MENIDPFQFASELEKELGLTLNFFKNLPKGDDWSFVIKLHSLVVAATTHMLTERFGNPKLSDIFGRLEMRIFKTGELAFVSSGGFGWAVRFEPYQIHPEVNYQAS